MNTETVCDAIKYAWEMAEIRDNYFFWNGINDGKRMDSREKFKSESLCGLAGAAKIM